MSKIAKALAFIERYKKKGYDAQADYQKHCLYSIITHSTALEGSSLTEMENELLLDKGISTGGKTMAEQLMNQNLKRAYEESIVLAERHEPFTVEGLNKLYRLITPPVSSDIEEPLLSHADAQTELREFCEWLNRQRAFDLSPADRYDLSFEAHYHILTIHPWTEGNGLMARLIMNQIQFEYHLLPSKVLVEDKGAYLKALTVTGDSDDITHFLDFMANETVKSISSDMDTYLTKIANSREKDNKTSTKRERSREKILILLKMNPKYSARKLAEEIGVTEKAIEKQLARLKAQGKIRREGPDKGGKWIVID